MADKDFRVKNKLHVNGLSQASGVILSTNNALDSHTNVPTQYGGTGTTVSPNAGQFLYSASGTTYSPTSLSTEVNSIRDTASAFLRSNRNISGGGDITFSGSLFWSSRFIVIANGSGSHFSTNGYYDINCPTSGTITGVGGAGNVTATAAGIPMSAWTALYYILTPNTNNGSDPTRFRISSYTSGVVIPSNWVLIAVFNGDDNHLYLNNGVTLAIGQSLTMYQKQPTVLRNQISANYTVAATDSGKLIESTHGSGIVQITLPSNLLAGFQVSVLQTAAGQCQMVAGAGSSLSFPSDLGAKTRTQWSSLTAIHRGSGAWVIVGDIAA